MRSKASTCFLLYLLALFLVSTIFASNFPWANGEEPPEARFDFTPLLPYVNETIIFDASASRPGSGYITLFFWNFGDNTTATGAIIEKSYNVSSNYTVTLLVISDIGLQDMAYKTVCVLPQPIGPSLDLYNQKGGEGRNQPSGDFAPGEMVLLSALLLFNDAPVEYKPVAFQIINAAGETIAYRSAMTDENGIARINFTILGECLPEIFGKWTVLATSTVSEQIVSDTLTFHVSGPMLDLYTQHPEPYSGRGLNQPSDAFAPQQEVILYAEAHYDCEPIEYKLVAFEVKDPNGQSIVYRENETDGNGIASVSFRLPSNAPFGIYTAFATVEILGRIANDTLTFKVGWLVSILEIKTTDLTGAAKSIFSRGEQVCYNITVENIAFTSKIATLTFTLYDAEAVTIGRIIFMNLLIPPGTLLISFASIKIPQWTFTGTAITYANAYTALPKLGGAPYCPEISVPITIIP